MPDLKEALFAAIIKHVKVSDLQVPWDEIAQESGYKNASNAKTMFSRYQKSLRGDNSRVSPSGGVQKTKTAPRKNVKKKMSEDDANGDTDELENAESTPIKRGRGRPKQLKVKEEPEDIQDEDEQPYNEVIKTEDNVSGDQDDAKTDATADGAESDIAEEMV